LIAKILYEKTTRDILLTIAMPRSFNHTIPGILFLLFVSFQTGRCAVIYSTVSQRELSVGDRVLYTVTAVVPKGSTIVPPDPANSFGPLVVKSWDNRKSVLAQADSISFDYVLTTYKAENCTIPPLPYFLENGEAHDTLRTESVPLTVIPLCRSDSADIMDLKPQQVTGKRPLLWLWLLLGVWAAAAAALAAWHYILKLKKPPPPPPPKPPYEEALEALTALEAKQYLQKGMIREYVFELSEILKRYIERRFGINAAEFTTEEMLAWLGISQIDKEQKNSLEWFFRAADPVKFAKFLPDRDIISRFGSEARGIIEATKPPSSASAAPQKQPEVRRET
jgi:hypothetical protein